MNIREAILKAADHIQSNPKEFNFGYVEVPHCGSPGCAVGWIEHFLGRKQNQLIDARCITGDRQCGIGSTEDVFYERMDKLHGSRSWRSWPNECASTLRAYADKYHPAEVQPVTEDRQLVPWSQCAWKPAVLRATP